MFEKHLVQFHIIAILAFIAIMFAGVHDSWPLLWIGCALMVIALIFFVVGEIRTQRSWNREPLPDQLLGRDLKNF